jgi:hypothetical protein
VVLVLADVVGAGLATGCVVEALEDGAGGVVDAAADVVEARDVGESVGHQLDSWPREGSPCGWGNVRC